VRKFAKDNSVNINLIKGTGNNGRVTKSDVELFMKGGALQNTATPASVAPQHRIAPLTGITEEDEVVNITGMKKAMTKTMTESLSIPFFTLSDEIDASALIKLRKEMKVAHPKLTMLPFFIKACSIAMSEYPLINSQVDNELDVDGFIQRYVVKKDHNFSIAIDSPEGLTVPNIKQCQTKSILRINDELKDLQ